jgi:acyl carrier protein
MKPVEDLIRAYITDNILFKKTYPYPDDASFLKNGVVDSTNIMELVMFIEEEFNITTEDNEIVQDNFDSITRLSNFIRKKLDSKTGENK